MKRTFVTASAALVLAALGVVIGSAKARADSGSVATETFTSKTLSRPIRYTIYSPASSATPDTPVLYLLHGRSDDERAWLDHGTVAATLDR